MIVVSIDPVTKQVAMFQVPRDMVDVPGPGQRPVPVGQHVYAGKINSWFTRTGTAPTCGRARPPRPGASTPSRRSSGKLYGLDIRYYVKVDFGGFRNVVDTIGGVQINVQMPVYESQYPAAGGLTRIYIPAGPQHMTGTQALRYARSRHRAAGGDFDRGRRQQRVLVSLKEQMSVQAIIANLDQLIKDVGGSVKTDIPTSELPKLLALADGVDTKNIRSYVFSPTLLRDRVRQTSPRGYIITPNVVRIRKAVNQAFKVSAETMALRDRLGAEAARVWVLNASGRSGLSARTAEYLAYNGLEASAPNRRIADQAAATKIVVYNGAESDDARDDQVPRGPVQDDRHARDGSRR